MKLPRTDIELPKHQGARAHVRMLSHSKAKVHEISSADAKPLSVSLLQDVSLTVPAG